MACVAALRHMVAMGSGEDVTIGAHPAIATPRNADSEHRDKRTNPDLLSSCTKRSCFGERYQQVNV
jgi:hypothetical protein